MSRDEDNAAIRASNRNRMGEALRALSAALKKAGIGHTLKASQSDWGAPLYLDVKDGPSVEIQTRRGGHSFYALEPSELRIKVGGYGGRQWPQNRAGTFGYDKIAAYIKDAIARLAAAKVSEAAHAKKVAAQDVAMERINKTLGKLDGVYVYKAGSGFDLRTGTLTEEEVVAAAIAAHRAVAAVRQQEKL